MTALALKTNGRPSAALNLSAQDNCTAARPHSLTQAVQGAVRAVDERTLRPVAHRDAGMAFQSKTLLALLTYCYAREIYCSVEVADVLRRDVTLRPLCNNDSVGALLISRFRHENR